jgi:ECF transporter S component (folate family)
MKKKNDRLFKTPFSMLYWKTASQEFNFTITIALASLLISMTIVLETIGKMFPLVIDNRQIYFSFLPISLSAMLFGPLVGLATGAICDILGYFVYSGGYAFFPGYILSAMLGAFIYSLFLYRTRITITRLFLSKLLVNLLVNVLLGSLWIKITYGKLTYWFYLYSGLIKNMALLPFEVILMYLLFKKMIPISKMHNLISLDIEDKINLI